MEIADRFVDDVMKQAFYIQKSTGCSREDAVLAITIGVLPLIGLSSALSLMLGVTKEMRPHIKREELHTIIKDQCKDLITHGFEAEELWKTIDMVLIVDDGERDAKFRDMTK